MKPHNLARRRSLLQQLSVVADQLDTVGQFPRRFPLQSERGCFVAISGSIDFVRCAQLQFGRPKLSRARASTRLLNEVCEGMARYGESVRDAAGPEAVPFARSGSSLTGSSDGGSTPRRTPWQSPPSRWPYRQTSLAGTTSTSDRRTKGPSQQTQPQLSDKRLRGAGARHFLLRCCQSPFGRSPAAAFSCVSARRTGGQTRDRSEDLTLFRRALYQLSYLTKMYPLRALRLGAGICGPDGI